MTIQELIERLQKYPADMEVGGMDYVGEKCDLNIWQLSSCDEEAANTDRDYIVITYLD